VSSDVEIVLLDVSVKDADGGFVSGLSKDSFRVFENGRLQEISIFASQDVPVTVGLVVDSSGSVRPKRSEIVTAALSFATKSHPKDEIFVVNFNDIVTLGLPPGMDFTDDIHKLRDALVNNPTRGRTSLHDALKASLKHLDKGRRDKKTLLLISDGGDNASATTKDEIFRLAQESTATIYTVGIFNPDDKEKNPDFLEKLAKITGGEYHRPAEIKDLMATCEKIAQDIRNRYTIGYAPDDRNFDGTVRKLKVLAAAPDRKKLVVRTRTQYIANPRQMAGR
jgi:VWFA-related protein